MIAATVFTFVLACLLFALFGAGLWCTYIGLRGRIVGDEPRCRRCDFDLSGRDAVPLRCSECGADLYDEWAVRYGRRHRRTGLALAGTAMVVAGVLPFVIAACS